MLKRTTQHSANDRLLDAMLAMALAGFSACVAADQHAAGRSVDRTLQASAADASAREPDNSPADAGADAAASSASAIVDAEWSPLAADASFEGKSLQDWIVAWARWGYAQTSCDDPAFDKDGSQCGLYQDPDSPVFFLATGDVGTERTLCEVPAGKAILVPLATTSWDNAGTDDADQLSEQQLREQVAGIVDSIVELSLRVDEREVADLSAYVVGPYKFSYTVPPKPNWYTYNGYPSVEGKVDPSFVGGAFVLLPPPTRGRHELHYRGALYVYGMKSENSVTMTLTVR
jgi:hypothetical protein